MTKESLYDVLGDINDNHIRDARIQSPKKNIPARVRWGVAACLCLVIAGAFAVRFIPDVNSPTTVNQFKVDVSDSSYHTPLPGECLFFTEVKAAREHYSGKDVTFLLAVDIFGVSEEEKNAEYQRLADLGYELYEAECWTYYGDGQKRYYTTVLGKFTESDLAGFEANEKCGYAFSFATNGDGSSVSVDEDDLITDFELREGGTVVVVC